jgi:hypothetical protein
MRLALLNFWIIILGIIRGMKKLTTEDIVNRFKKVHGERYDYRKVVYTGCNEKVNIICPEHGMFKQLVGNHSKGHGCKQCYYERKTLSKEEFIERAKKVHGERYDYSKVIYTGYDEKVNIICPEHGMFKQTVANHLSGQGCPLCGIQRTKKAKTKQVYCPELDMYFGSQTEAAEYIGLSNESISGAIRGRFKSAGKCPTTGVRLTWKRV